MDAPDGKLDTLLIQCVVPSQHVLINAVNKRAVQIKKKGGLRLHHDCELYKGNELRTAEPTIEAPSGS
jgi:hypothetical protein